MEKKKKSQNKTTAHDVTWAGLQLLWKVLTDCQRTEKSKWKNKNPTFKVVMAHRKMKLILYCALIFHVEIKQLIYLDGRNGKKNPTHNYAEFQFT